MSDLYDYLTGLYNRKGMNEVWNYHEGEKELVQILFLDLDNFKTVNDMYGHKMGDHVLTRFGEILRRVAEGKGEVIRLGGDEFVMMFFGQYERQVLADLAEKLMGLVRTEMEKDKGFGVISVSMGIVLNAAVSEGLDNLLSYGDAAMYYAKESGKNQYVFFGDYEEKIREERLMESTAMLALEEGRFRVTYFPVMHLQNSKLLRTGAVAVWEKEDGTVWSRKDYEAVLYKSGIIKNIDLFLMEQVCKDLARFQKTIDMREPVGIWLSGILSDLDFVPRFQNLIRQYGLSCEQIELWVDERMFSHRRINSLLKNMEKIQKAGFQIGLMGVGKSFLSFPYLEEINLSTILFDDSHIAGMQRMKMHGSMMHAMFQMTRDLNLLSVGMGVDTAIKAGLLIRSGCEAGCGEYFQEPLYAEDYYQYRKGIVERETVAEFPFLKDYHTADGKYHAEAIGEVQFSRGISKLWGGIRFLGGPIETNVLKLPAEIFSGAGYTVTFWVKPQEVQNWISAFYARHQLGFSSFMPSISGNQTMFRVHLDEESELWKDAMYAALPVGKWTYVALVYDAKKGNILLFLNGEFQVFVGDVPEIGRVTMAYLGGDSYQVSFRGEISALRVYDHSRTMEEIKASFLEYKNEPGFCGDDKADEKEEYWVHDPAIYEDEEHQCFYLYCTGAQGWKSKDLIHWDPLDRVVESVPKEARDWTNSDAIWAPDIVKVGEKYRLYCSNSSWGSQKSCIFLATADDPAGPFTPGKVVLKTDDTLDVNGIDANIIEDPETKEQYLLYGSFWGGVHILPLDKATGLARDAGEDGLGVGSLRLDPDLLEKCLAGMEEKEKEEPGIPALWQLPERERERRRGSRLVSRPAWTSSSVEGPYMIWHPQTKYYYLFVSYGSLKSDYNIRVGRSKKITGPFLDYYGRDLADPQDDDLSRGLLISGGYRWITGVPFMGPGHNSVLLRKNGEMFLVGHIRKMHFLEKDIGPGLLQIRRMFMTPDGWPIVSPQPYAEETFRRARLPVIPGTYERIELRPSIPQGIAHAHPMTLFEDGRMECCSICGTWRMLDEFSMELTYGPIREFIHVEKGLDFDLNKSTILLSGLTSQGICTWGKKILE